MARWLADGGYALAEWETDLSSQTGASQAGILLGSNDDIPAFRWVEKETATTDDAARTRPTAPRSSAAMRPARGLLRDGGASRGNLLSGEADHVILTVSRMDAEKRANPGYRAFFANGFNVTRMLVLFVWEVSLELDGRGARSGAATCGRAAIAAAATRSCAAAMCVVVRDLIVFGVLTDMMKGRPAVYATFSSYDEVAHHSGPRARRHARGAAQARPAVRPDRRAPAGTRRGRTRSSCSPTTARRRARRSSSATATGSTTSSSARCRRRHATRDRGRRRERRDGRQRGRRGDRPRSGSKRAEETTSPASDGGRARLGQPRARLPDGGARAG